MLPVLPQGCRRGGGQSLPLTRTPYPQVPKASGLTNFRGGSGILGARPRPCPRESKLAGVGGGAVRLAEEEVGSGSCGPSEELLAAGALFKGGKMDFFFSSHKVCIVAQRGALMTAKGLRGWDNLGSVPPAPCADHLPEGHKQAPGCQAPAVPSQAPALRLLTNTVIPDTLAPGAKAVPRPWQRPASETPQRAREGTSKRELRESVSLRRAREREIGNTGDFKTATHSR